MLESSPISLESNLMLIDYHWSAIRGNWSCPEHLHSRYFEIMYIYEGCLDVKLGGKWHPLHSGDLVILRPHQLHAFRAKDPHISCTILCFHFTMGDLELIQMLNQSSQSLYSAQSLVAMSLKRACADLFSPVREKCGFTVTDRMKIIAELYRFMEILANDIAESRSSDGAISNLSHRQLARTMAGELEKLLRCRFYEHAENPEGDVLHNIHDIYRQVGLSQAKCSRIFRSVYHKSPREYLSDLILQEAKLLLMNEHLSVEQIGERLGYQDAGTFSRQFKRWTGISPNGYRNRRKEVPVDSRR